MLRKARNPHSLTVAAKDNIFQQALKRADILLPDGTGIIIAAKILGLPCTEKVAGTDFFLGLSREANKRGGGKYFFIGSSEKVLGLIEERMKLDFPAIEVCGTYSPPFKTEFSQEDNSAMISAVNNAQPDVLWVGMTAPKQEKWIYENLSNLQVPFIAAIGAVFDFYAGTKKRSSDFWIKIGLEWLPRFLKEPRRLWERNLKSTPIFLWWMLKAEVRGRRSEVSRQKQGRRKDQTNDASRIKSPASITHFRMLCSPKLIHRLRRPACPARHKRADYTD